MRLTRYRDIKYLAGFISISIGIVCGLLALVITMASIKPGHSLASAGINQQLSFTGKLVNKTTGTNISDGTYNMEFNIYQDGNSSGSGGTLKWTEDYLVSGSTGMPTTAGVTVTSGTFQVSLGSICALSGGTCGNKTNAGASFNQDTLWLSIDLGNTSACTVTSSTSSFDTTGAGNCNGDTQMTPYVRLTSVPYALNTLNFGTMSVSGNTYTTTGGASFATTGANGFSFKPGTDTNGAFQITNAGGTNIANFDTSSPTGNNLVSNPSFESTVSGWSASGSASSPAQSSAQSYEGSKSLLAATTGSNGGASYTTGSTFLTQNSNYSLTFFAKTDSTQSVTTFEAGYSYNAGTNFVSCLTGQTLTAGWRLFRCSFIETSATSGNPFIYFRQTDSATRDIYIDDVVLQLDANATNDYHNATLDLTGTNIQGPIILKDTTDDTTAFQIQNPSGVQIFNVDTTDTNLVTNPGFEVNTSSWTLINGATNLYRDTTRSYLGIASGRFTTTSTSNSGIRYTFPSQLTSGNYVISFYAMTSAADSTLNADFNNGSSDAPCTGLTPTRSSTVPSTTGWIRFYCTVATSSISSIFITSGTTAVTLNIDGVQVEPGTTTPTNYAAGSLSFNGTINTAVVFQAGSNSTTAFQVQNSGGTNLFSVDTLNNYVQIGSATTDSTAIQLVLDSYNNATDPTGVAGGMYYNTATSTFRCYQGGAWRNCLGGGSSNASTATQAPTATSDTYITNSSVPLPTGGLRGPTGSAQDGSKITWRLVVTKTAAGTAASTITIRVGTAGTTSDTARCTAFSTGTATAVADVATIYITVYATAGGSTATLNCSSTLTHVLATTGWNTGGYAVQAYSTQTSFDSTPAGTKIGLSFNGGTALVSTIQSVDVTTYNL